MGGPRRVDISAKSVARLYRSGLSAQDIAERFGTTDTVILKRLKDSGTPRRRRGRFSAIPITQLIAMYRVGSNCALLARHFGVTRAAIKWRLKRAGVRIRRVVETPIGAAHPKWRGGRWRSTDGYVTIWIGRNRRAFEHRVVMSNHLGRPLTKDEIVHHLNGIRDDNRLSNLVLTNRTDHEHHTYVKRLQERILELEAHVKSHEVTLQGQARWRR